MPLFDIKILLVAGNIDNELVSFEHVHFFNNLKKLVTKVDKFDFKKVEEKIGNERLQDKLLEYVYINKPDYTIIFVQENEFQPETIIKLNAITKTVAYLYDDPWRMNYSISLSKYFNYITTSDVNGIRKFNDNNVYNIIYSPFFSDSIVYKKLNSKKEYDVSFFGGYHPVREWFYKQLKSSGINIKMFGPGWDSQNFLNTEEIVKIINKSKIILNISNSMSWDIRQLMFTKYKKFPINNLKLLRENIKYYNGIKDRKDIEMIKMRTFEIAACGTAQITFYSEGLEKYFEIGNEIIVYTTINDLIEKIRYYLKYKNELDKISNNCYKRFLENHSADIRLKKLIEDLVLLN